MDNDTLDIILDFLYDEEEEIDLEDIEREEIDLDLYIEELTLFEVNVLHWIEEALIGHNCNEGSVPINITPADIYAESLRGRK